MDYRKQNPQNHLTDFRKDSYETNEGAIEMLQRVDHHLLPSNDRSRLALNHHVLCASKVQPSGCKGTRLIEVIHDTSNFLRLELMKRNIKNRSAKPSIQ
ncbi:unnamed protein product [Linum trigynum]|uniref:Uncharacterized protein n=1 Tax=Linum trigynum TaxID=586398 RepID=A0AAV2CTS9_9ROSI